MSVTPLVRPRKAALFFLFMAALFPIAAEAKVYIDIDSPAGKRLPLAIAELVPLEGGVVADDTLKAFEVSRREIESALSGDIGFSGLFDVIGKDAYLEAPSSGITPGATRFALWRTIGAEVLIKGAVKLRENMLTAEFRLFDTIRETQLFARRYVGRPADARAIAHRFADDMIETLTGRRGIFSTKLAFVSDATGSKEVYISDYDGRNPKRITSGGSINLSPQWSPDGKKLIYTSYLRGEPYLYIHDLTGRGVEPVSTRPGLNIAGRWSPDGKTIALTMNGRTSPDLFLLKLDSKRYVQLTDNRAIDVSPTWAPDSKRLAFVSDMAGNPHIYVLDSEGKNLKRLTFEGRYNSEPSWSPDGGMIAFARRDKNSFNIWVMREDGGGLKELTFDGDNKSPSWSPDGRYIVFSSVDGKGRNTLFIMPRDGSGMIKVDPGVGSETGPAWSPYINE
ncbi:MAG: Tol-Pal system beta propeller repeat protein TolB [Deltaproteobacteria bacterium]|nr:Tol-Pal system beta propeller repeat protein TolB [Deltaproteobacteria bacterium]